MLRKVTPLASADWPNYRRGICASVGAELTVGGRGG
jgi:hypothetical protein